MKDLTLQISEGEFSVLLGTSSSGKSTTLKMINRLVEFDAVASIRRLDARDLRRRIGYAIQSIGLFPHWTVEKISPLCLRCSAGRKPAFARG